MVDDNKQRQMVKVSIKSELNIEKLSKNTTIDIKTNAFFIYQSP